MAAEFPVKKVLGVYALPPPPLSHNYYVARFVDCAAPSDGLAPAPDLKIFRPTLTQATGATGEENERLAAQRKLFRRPPRRHGRKGGKIDASGDDDELDIDADKWHLSGFNGRNYVGRELSQKSQTTRTLLLTLENAGSDQPHFTCAPVTIVEFTRNTRDFNLLNFEETARALKDTANRQHTLYTKRRQGAAEDPADSQQGSLGAFRQVLAAEYKAVASASTSFSSGGGGGGGGRGGFGEGFFGGDLNDRFEAADHVDFENVFSDDEDVDTGRPDEFARKDEGSDADQPELPEEELEFQQDEDDDVAAALAGSDAAAPGKKAGGRKLLRPMAAGATGALARPDLSEPMEGSEEEDVSDIDLSDADENEEQDTAGSHRPAALPYHHPALAPGAKIPPPTAPAAYGVAQNRKRNFSPEDGLGEPAHDPKRAKQALSDVQPQQPLQQPAAASVQQQLADGTVSEPAILAELRSASGPIPLKEFFDRWTGTGPSAKENGKLLIPLIKKYCVVKDKQWLSLKPEFM